jgi:hypothetical protein
LHLACCRKRVERPLHGPLARSERQRKGRARPRFTVGEESEHGRMLLFDGPGQHDDLASAARRQRKTSLGRAHLGHRPKDGAKPPYFHSQARAMSVSLGTSPGHASPSARAIANNTGRLASEITLLSARTT